MKFVFSIAITLLIQSSSTEDASDSVRFDGNFSSIEVSNSACEDIFSTRSYQSQFTLFGPSRRTLVSRFTNLENEGFLHEKVFVSNFGYQNDFIWNEDYQLSSSTLTVSAYGFCDKSVVVIDFEIEKRDSEGNLVCTAKARYSGFNP